MADSSHLEKMGRELKCPICLSLLNSAVSLTCNHVFCSLCIEKSMKSASSCPVCKVPYRRREVRPAPHMDNLVSIYKSMEVASGFNIFVTQTVPSTKLSDEENQSVGGLTSGRQENGRTWEEAPGNQRGVKGKQSKKSLKISKENSNLDHLKPSFPTKKRVQVPQYPPSEAPVQPATFGLGEIAKAKLDKSLVIKEKSAVNGKGDTAFTPFFWLRDEEDVEKVTQQTDEGGNMDTPPNAPCFSDIKDSDDEIPSEVSPKGRTDITHNYADYFDSEMFECTQRPCSPELCSSPMKRQVADSDEFDGIQVKKCKLSAHGGTTNGKHGIENIEDVVPKQRADDVEVSLTAMSSPRKDNTNTNDKLKKSNKRGRKVSERRKKKQAKRTIDEAPRDQVDLERVAKCAIHEKILNENIKSLHSNKRTCKGDKKVMFDSSAAESVPETVSSFSAEPNTLNLDNNRVTDFQHSTDQKKSSMKSVVQQQIDIPKRTRNRINSKCQEQRCSNKRKISTLDISKDNKLVKGIRDGCNEVSVEKTQPMGKLQSTSEVRDLQAKKLEEVPPALNGVVLRKCETVTNKIQCAFCHSTEDTEASGIMVHYLNGKPVAADYNGGSKVIHAHRNCTEWAPNVYFEDDNTINLEAELARSRRIKCCCCDIKGAALGCYEKSCRKSFHFPCAKLIAQCRWDNDNFVMLCPLHASSALPNELCGSQIKRKQKCIPKRPSKSHQSEVAVIHASNTRQRWDSSGSFGKLVLCCSALTKEEKEIVSDFGRLSGATVLKNWGSCVTHVIASTDENGACRRTIKILMGILEGKWILSTAWIKACMKTMEPVDEQLYEIAVDIHGIRDGPRLGRLRHVNKQPKLFDGCKFYFTGEFIPSYKGYLYDLVVAAGGTVLQRKPISRDQESLSSENPRSSVYIIYSLEFQGKCDPNKNSILNQRRKDAEALASSTGAIVASNSWVLNSIAASNLQNLGA
ncbi:hypothetical protein RHMOL_Rhmol13G0161800 [Rhododendron molle]|uniref:Uncharacterized protein n=1 Tax=Rhododendron molle TaxID=49168 RepID=A0ACC0L7S7_RHOML|nr:hypothetical protein RHMOL_Rhmol13G0161800 [Rhododendron molle]